MRASILVIAAGLATCSAGCTHMRLEKNTVQLSASLTDLRYKQVLNNLAMIAHNSSMLPYYSIISGGTSQVVDSANINGGLGWGWDFTTGANNSQTLGLGGSHETTENWSLDPLHDPERLKAMRCVYQTVIGQVSNAKECCELIQAFNLKEEIAKIPQGWFDVGCRRDVPKDACYVGNYCDTYVWVNGCGLEGLTRLSLIMLDIATVSMDSVHPTKKVVRKYDNHCNLTGVEVTQDIDESDPNCLPETEWKKRYEKKDDCNSDDGSKKVEPKKQRREMYPSYRGLLSLPR